MYNKIRSIYPDRYDCSIAVDGAGINKLMCPNVNEEFATEKQERLTSRCYAVLGGGGGILYRLSSLGSPPRM